MAFKKDKAMVARHDLCLRRFWQTLKDASLEPGDIGEPGHLLDVETKNNWGGRHLWDVKITRNDGTVWISLSEWEDWARIYGRESVWIVLGRYDDAEAFAVIGLDEIANWLKPRGEPSEGIAGWRFRFHDTNVHRDGLTRFRELYATFLRSPAELEGKKACGTCRRWLPIEEGFARNRAKPDGRQYNCRECDRDREWIPGGRRQYERERRAKRNEPDLQESLL